MNATLTPTHKRLGLTDEILATISLALSKHEEMIRNSPGIDLACEPVREMLSNLDNADAWLRSVQSAILADEIASEESR